MSSQKRKRSGAENRQAKLQRQLISSAQIRTKHKIFMVIACMCTVADLGGVLGV